MIAAAHCDVCLALLLGGCVAAVVGGSTFCERLQGDDQPPGRKLAFLVGVDEYQHAKLDKLDFAERDVDELAGLLRGQGYTVVLLKGEKGGAEDRRGPERPVGRRDAPGFDHRRPRGAWIAARRFTGRLLLPLRRQSHHRAGPSAISSCAAFPEKLLKITGGDGLIARLDNSGVGQKLLSLTLAATDNA